MKNRSVPSQTGSSITCFATNDVSVPCKRVNFNECTLFQFVHKHFEQADILGFTQFLSMIKWNHTESRNAENHQKLCE